jgi:lysyl-tRNA synthetase class 2
MNMSQEFNKVKFRSEALAKTRHFFSQRGFLEVDVPICNKGASIDAYIDLFTIENEGYLHSSPELRMKDLLSQGSGNIYFLGHVFRKEENGSRHNFEFTMLEYYRVETTEEIFLSEFIDYISLFLGNRPVVTLSFDEAMKRYAPKTVPEGYSDEEVRHYILSHFVEPALGRGNYTLLTNFPPSEASLAQTAVENGVEVAKRYELFVDGVELANGFFELSCKKTATERFSQANFKRIKMGKEPYLPDTTFLKNLSLPENTYGIAVGFDRLLMLTTKASDIHQVIL